MSNRALWPQGWIVLTHREWERRTEEYSARRREAAEARLARPLHEQEEMEQERGEKGKEFESGLIVHIERLHAEVNKPSISSFVMRSVDRYLRKKEGGSAEKRKEKEEKEGRHNNPKVQINYIDYKKGSDNCYLRQSAAADSELIVAALKKRKRAMRDGSDGKGFKEKERFVVGRILEGEEERHYWKKVQDTIRETAAARKGRKGNSKGQAAAEEAGMANVRVGARNPGKRPRLSTGSVVMEGKRKKFDS